MGRQAVIRRQNGIVKYPGMLSVADNDLIFGVRMGVALNTGARFDFRVCSINVIKCYDIFQKRTGMQYDYIYI